MTLIIYVVLLESRLPELPLPAAHKASQPAGFAGATTGPLHAGPHGRPRASDQDIVLNPHARDPLVIARVDIPGLAVTAVETPPHVRSGGHPDSDVLMAPRDSRWAPVVPRNHIDTVAPSRTAPHRRPQGG